MNRRRIELGGVLLVSLVPLVAGTNFTWTGNGSDNAWDTCGNWDACDPSFLRHWPQSTSDDGVISGSYTVDMIDGIVTIDDLTLSGGGTIVFDDENELQFPFLRVDVLTIEGGSASGSDTVVVIQNTARLETYSN